MSLTVTCEDPQTFVLLLHSVEPAVRSQACESLRIWCAKSPDNLTVAVNLGTIVAVEALIRAADLQSQQAAVEFICVALADPTNIRRALDAGVLAALLNRVIEPAGGRRVKTAGQGDVSVNESGAVIDGRDAFEAPGGGGGADVGDLNDGEVDVTTARLDENLGSGLAMVIAGMLTSYACVVEVVRLGVVSALCKLLDQDHRATILHASRACALLASDHRGRVALRESGALPKLMSVAVDPHTSLPVRQQAAFAISLVVRDYGSRMVLRDTGSIGAILQVLQDDARILPMSLLVFYLRTMSFMVQERTNSVIFRESNGFEIFSTLVEQFTLADGTLRPEDVEAAGDTTVVAIREMMDDGVGGPGVDYGVRGGPSAGDDFGGMRTGGGLIGTTGRGDMQRDGMADPVLTLTSAEDGGVDHSAPLPDVFREPTDFNVLLPLMESLVAVCSHAPNRKRFHASGLLTVIAPLLNATRPLDLQASVAHTISLVLKEAPALPELEAEDIAALRRLPKEYKLIGSRPASSLMGSRNAVDAQGDENALLASGTGRGGQQTGANAVEAPYTDRIHSALARFDPAKPLLPMAEAEHAVSETVAITVRYIVSLIAALTGSEASGSDGRLLAELACRPSGETTRVHGRHGGPDGGGANAGGQSVVNASTRLPGGRRGGGGDTRGGGRGGGGGGGAGGNVPTGAARGGGGQASAGSAIAHGGVAAMLPFTTEELEERMLKAAEDGGALDRSLTALSEFTKTYKDRSAIRRSGGVFCLCELLSHPQPRIRAQATAIVSTMAREHANRAAFRSAGAVPALLANLGTVSSDTATEYLNGLLQRTQAKLEDALGEGVKKGADDDGAGGEDGVLDDDDIVSPRGGPRKARKGRRPPKPHASGAVVGSAAAAAASLGDSTTLDSLHVQGLASAVHAIELRISANNEVNGLCSVLARISNADDDLVVRVHAASALASLTRNVEAREQVLYLCGLPRLIPLLQSPSCDVRRVAAWVLAILASSPEAATSIIELGGLDQLQSIVLQSSVNSSGSTDGGSTIGADARFAADAVQQVLDHSLSAK